MEPTRTDVLTVVAVAAALTAWNNGVGATDWHERRYVPANLAGTAALLAIARSRGLRSADLGLEAGHLWAGARVGGALAATVGGVLGAALVSPSGRRLLHDERIARLTVRETAHHAALRVPVGTALWEEVAFRAVLPGLLSRAMPARRAEALSHLLFGVWHVRPALDAARINGVRAPLGQAAVVAGSVAATAGVGALFTWLRRRTGSLVAPVVLHAATNSAATLAAAVAARAPYTTVPPDRQYRPFSRSRKPASTR